MRGRCLHELCQRHRRRLRDRLDCGGATCDACYGAGSGCASNSDCVTGKCDGLTKKCRVLLSHSADPAATASGALAWGCTSTASWGGSDAYVMKQQCDLCADTAACIAAADCLSN